MRTIKSLELSDGNVVGMEFTDGTKIIVPKDVNAAILISRGGGVVRIDDHYGQVVVSVTGNAGVMSRWQ
ncbi:hypothetical protein A3G55_01875 [Candidatus Giovannonibacteria bacterium RIFCSPLOWO2_12_FULL_44_25]|uniref:Uncharacterized protein n=3 Tax=Parcubacteria group TaxID=1794811 RepID=A0A837IKZ1_9BACT|nr:MAG: hypothetical protein UW15_C0024G0008 [Parcubacteria group bacterium GW2011_GWC1_44_10]KKT60194.1 MAG: hypothetical protein UW53_C0003G0105 [Candidatus Giovannonibacteria bacterium GW2011_GWA1_44_25]KKU12462.1 MAG: hypothetical protein UX18_C0023G0007 [Candidatus Azambacteria bacterium GW2011_GWC2_45_7b]KKU30041.1 MAG: hypothetical protein UX43_C0003G0134 [Candidatus Giovannonibacteria bacterium GW2011_GWB1_46_20]OGF49398.1 MAG: hypothetical protein A2120_03710 [Candidatus Giovannonibact